MTTMTESAKGTLVAAADLLMCVADRLRAVALGGSKRWRRRQKATTTESRMIGLT